MTAGTLAHLRRRDLDGWILAAFIIAKLAYEQFAGAMPFAGAAQHRRRCAPVWRHRRRSSLALFLQLAAASRSDGSRYTSRPCQTAKHLAFVFPGQGSQSVGMLGEARRCNPPWCARTFDEASKVLGYDLWQLCQQGPVEELNATERTQPAMLAAGIATWRLWQERKGATPAIVTGHSLGEFTALVAAGAIDFATCVDLVRFRGQVMQEAVPAGTRRHGCLVRPRGCGCRSRVRAKRPRRPAAWSRP